MEDQLSEPKDTDRRTQIQIQIDSKLGRRWSRRLKKMQAGVSFVSSALPTWDPHSSLRFVFLFVPQTVCFRPLRG